MNKQKFDFEFGKKHGVNSFQLTDELTVFRKPLEIWNEKTDESICFKNVNELLKYEIEPGITVWDIIEKKDSLYGDLTFHKRGGESKNNKTFKMGHAGGGGGGLGVGGEGNHVPAEANVQIKTKTYEEALKNFQKNFASADHEYAYEVDKQGFVHFFNEGEAHAVSLSYKSLSNKNSVIVHNHPSDGHFSDTDLLNLSNYKSGGVVAVGKTNTYSVFKKDGRFNATGFAKMIKKASRDGIQGKSYDDAVHKMLTANQKKYGYTYTRTKTKS